MTDAIVAEEWDQAFYPKNSITFCCGNDDVDGLLRVAVDGFYVRGVKVEADADEAAKVYSAFKQWLAWTALATK